MPIELAKLPLLRVICLELAECLYGVLGFSPTLANIRDMCTWLEISGSEIGR